MALLRQKAHERRLKELNCENDSLRKDVDKLEEVLTLHKRHQTDGDSSLKGMMRKEVGCFWQHGADGKMHSYKSSKDLWDKTKNSVQGNTSYSRKTPKSFKAEPTLEKLLATEKLCVKGGSNIGAKTKSVRSSHKSGHEKEHKSEIEIRQMAPSQSNSDRESNGVAFTTGTENRSDILHKMVHQLKESINFDDQYNSSHQLDYTKDLDHSLLNWLLELDLKNVEKYIDIFITNEIDMDSLKLLNESKLKEMGITAVGPLTKLLNAIEKLNETHQEKVCNISDRRHHNLFTNRSFSKTSRSKTELNDSTVHRSASTRTKMETTKAKTIASARKVIKGVKSDRETNKSSSKRYEIPSVENLNSGKRGKNLKISVPSKKDGAGNERGEVKTLVEDISEDEAETDIRCLEFQADVNTFISGQDKMKPIVIPQHQPLDEQSICSDDEAHQELTMLKVIEKEIRQLVDNIKDPGAIEKITCLQNQLREIQRQILVKRENTTAKGAAKPAQSDKTCSVAEPAELNLQNQTFFFTTPVLKKPYKTSEIKEKGDLKGPSQKFEDSYLAIDAENEILGEMEEKSFNNGSQAKAAAVNEIDNAECDTALVPNRNMSKDELLKKVRKQKEDHRKQIRHLESELTRLKHKDPLRSCEIKEYELHYSQKDLIGEGAFSQVFHGIYQGLDVAIKKLNVPLNSQDKNYFMAEVNLLKDLRHPRVLLMVGVCTSSKFPLMVLEYMAIGSLYNYLHNAENCALDHAAYYQIARDTALGMNYLHLHKPAVLHLDLKSMNVLLNLQLRAKIADFGFSKLRHDADMKAKQMNNKKSQIKGTPAWLAPEMLDFRPVTTKSDVYSYGVILWEMLTRRHPYQGCSVFQILERVRTNKRPEIPKDCPLQLAKLINQCWDKNLAKRPQFKSILTTLDDLHFPAEWKELFTSAGIPKSALNDIDATRTLIDIVSQTLEKNERPFDVPVLELYNSDSDDDTNKNNQQFNFSLSSSEDEFSNNEGKLSKAQEAKQPESHTLEEEVDFYNKLADALKDFNNPSGNSESRDFKSAKKEKQIKNSEDIESFHPTKKRNTLGEMDSCMSVNSGIMVSKSNDWSSVLSEYKAPCNYVSTQNTEVQIGHITSTDKNKEYRYGNEQTIQHTDASSKAITRRIERDGIDNINTNLKPLKTTDVLPQQATTNDRLQLSASTLVNQKGKLKSTNVPHPKQLPDLTQVESSQLLNLTEILKKAVTERRTKMAETNTLDTCRTTSWDLTEE